MSKTNSPLFITHEKRKEKSPKIIQRKENSDKDCLIRFVDLQKNRFEILFFLSFSEIILYGFCRSRSDGTLVLHDVQKSHRPVAFAVQSRDESMSGIIRVVKNFSRKSSFHLHLVDLSNQSKSYRMTMELFILPKWKTIKFVSSHLIFTVNLFSRRISRFVAFEWNKSTSSTETRNAFSFYQSFSLILC